MKKYKIKVWIPRLYEIYLDAESYEDAEDLLFEEYDPIDIEMLGELVEHGDFDLLDIEEA